MYDFTYTPFMSSMVIAWIVLNHKYLLIYMASFDLDKKLKLLENYDFSMWGIQYMSNIILPITFGLFYTFAYPWLSQLFYSYTLNRNKTLKTIKTQVEDKTPITEEEAKSLKKENYERTEKILELEDKITTIENDTKDKITTELNIKHKKEVAKLQKNYDNDIEKKLQEINADYQDAYQELSKEKSTLDKQFKQINDENNTLKLENENLRKQIPKKQDDEENDEDKVLRYFYEKNYKPIPFENALDSVVKETNLPRPKVSKIILDLIKKEICAKKQEGSLLYITSYGNSYLVKKFDKETKK